MKRFLAVAVFAGMVLAPGAAMAQGFQTDGNLQWPQTPEIGGNPPPERDDGEPRSVPKAWPGTDDPRSRPPSRPARTGQSGRQNQRQAAPQQSAQPQQPRPSTYSAGTDPAPEPQSTRRTERSEPRRNEDTREPRRPAQTANQPRETDGSPGPGPEGATAGDALMPPVPDRNVAMTPPREKSTAPEATLRNAGDVAAASPAPEMPAADQPAESQEQVAAKTPDPAPLPATPAPQAAVTPPAVSEPVAPPPQPAGEASPPQPPAPTAETSPPQPPAPTAETMPATPSTPQEAANSQPAVVAKIEPAPEAPKEQAAPAASESAAPQPEPAPPAQDAAAAPAVTPSPPQNEPANVTATGAPTTTGPDATGAPPAPATAEKAPEPQPAAPPPQSEVMTVAPAPAPAEPQQAQEAPQPAPPALEAAVPQPAPAPAQPEQQPSVARADAALLKLAGQMVVTGFEGTAPEDPDVRAVIKALRAGTIGGVIVTDRNIKSSRQLKTLMAALRGAVAEPVPLMVISHEGGAGQGMSAEKGFSAYPSASALGRSNDPLNAFNVYRYMAEELAAYGFNVNLGPVIDMDQVSPAEDERADGRSYGVSPKHVAAFAKAFRLAHHQKNIQTVLKHFPPAPPKTAEAPAGDPREVLRELIEDADVDLVMASGAAAAGAAGADAVPAELSEAALAELRGGIGFQGAVISGDLEAAELVGRYALEDRVLRAVTAGNDILLVGMDSAPQSSLGVRIGAIIGDAVAAGTLKREAVQAANARIAQMKESLGGSGNAVASADGKGEAKPASPR